MIKWCYSIFIKEANMNQTPLKKIIKISSFFLLTLMTYIIYYQALNPYSVKKF